MYSTGLLGYMDYVLFLEIHSYRYSLQPSLHNLTLPKNTVFLVAALVYGFHDGCRISLTS